MSVDIPMYSMWITVRNNVYISLRKISSSVVRFSSESFLDFSTPYENSNLGRNEYLGAKIYLPTYSHP
jgi:hypothetical protein